MYETYKLGTSSSSWTQLSRFYLKMETESSLQNIAILNKNSMMDNVWEHNISYLHILLTQKPI
jgi:hypothetical protein